MKRVIALVAVLALSLCCLAGCSQGNGLKLGTGNTEGNYYKYGQLLGEASNSANGIPAIKVEGTAGSSANLRLLSQNFLDLGIVQADTLYDAYNGTGLFSNSGKYTGYSAVASLYTEAVQIIVRADSGITSVADLAGKTVSLGERESGVLQNAKQILDAYNLKEADLNTEYLSFSDSASALQSGSIDAAFITSAVPTPAVANLAQSTSIRVLSLSPDVVSALVKHNPYYTAYAIPANTYAGQDAPVETIGVRAILVARNGMPNDQVAAILSLLYGGKIDFAGNLGDSMQPVLEEATLAVTVPFHPGTEAFYSSNGVTVEVDNNQGGGSKVAGGQDK